MVPSPVKSRPATRSNTCRPGSLAPVIQRGAGDDPGVEQVPDPRRALLAQRGGPDVALDQAGVGVELGERLDLGGRDGGLEALEVDLAVAGHADDEGLPVAVRVHDA